MKVGDELYTMEGYPAVVTGFDPEGDENYPYIVEIDRFGEVETTRYTAKGEYVIGKKSMQDLDFSDA